MKKNFSKKRKGFTLIELIIVLVIIAILALVAFSGGKRTIAKSKMSVVQSDFHTIEIAVKQMLLEHPEYITLKSTEVNFAAKRVAALNRYLPDEMQLSGTTTVTSAKADPWSQPYRVVFTPNDTAKIFTVHVLSNGPNTVTAGTETKVDKDDLVMCIELSGGDVKSKTWGFTEDNVADTSLKTLAPTPQSPAPGGGEHGGGTGH